MKKVLNKLKNNKKLKEDLNTLSIVILICLAVFLYEVAFDKITLELLKLKENSYKEQDDYSICIEVDSNSELDDIPLAYTDIDEKYYVMLSKKLELIPESMLSEIYEQGWGIILTNEDLAKMYFPDKYYKVQALTSYKQKLIVIEATERYLNEAPLHEIGHVVEYINNRAGRTEIFNSIFEKEKDNFKSTTGKEIYAKTNVQEYFAEAFQEYVINPNQLQENCPMTYGYIGSIVERYRQKDIELGNVK